MIRTLLTLAVFLSFRANASVWDQMQEGQTSPVVATINSFELLANRVRVHFTPTDGHQSQSAMLCDDFGRANENQMLDSEERRAAFFREWVQNLREAYHSGERVEIAQSGPWSPCIRSVNLTTKP